MAEELQVPACLVKLEKFRAKHTRYFAQKRELQARVNDLHTSILHLERDNDRLRPHVGKEARVPHPPGAHFTVDLIEKNNKAIAAYRAMLQVAVQELEGCEDLAEDARLFEGMRNHLVGELRAWGLE